MIRIRIRKESFRIHNTGDIIFGQNFNPYFTKIKTTRMYFEFQSLIINLFEESLYPQKWMFSVNPMLLPTVRDGRFVDDEIPQEMRNIQYDLSPERMEKVWVCKNQLDHLCQGSVLGFFAESSSRSFMN
jgi:hypothetical protein